MFDRKRVLNPTYPSYFSPSMDPDPIWFYYGYKDAEVGRYKVHISIQPDQFEQAKDNVHHLLHEAIEEGLILLYKSYKTTYSKGSNDSLRLRQAHFPFVIYLNDNYDENHLKQLAELFQKIEALLVNNKINPGNVDYLSKADFPLSPYVIFRQAYFNSADKSVENYIQAEDEEKIPQLIIECKNSVPYQVIRMHMLIKNFSKQVDELVNVLENYEQKLIQIKNGLLLKYADNDIKVRIVSEKLNEIQRQIVVTKINNAQLIDAEYKDYQVAKKELNKEIKSLTESMIKMTEFDDEDKNLLFAHRETDATKLKIMGVFKVRPDTQNYIETLTQDTHDRLINSTRKKL